MIRFDAIERLERNARRVGEIATVLARYGLADWLKGIRYSRLQEWLQSADGQAIRDLTLEARLREAFTELGTTFVKLGQLLSTRPDLIGPNLAEELTKLQSGAPADPVETARATFEAELGRLPEQVFDEFENEAFASASIAQVHRAWLRTGEPVVVKIQKAGIEEKIHADLSILAGLAELAEKHSTDLKSIEPTALVRQFRRVLLQELDFTYERRNLEEFGRNFAEDDTVHFPRPWRESSGRRVLTMEYLDGIRGNEPDRLRASGVDLNEFAHRGASMFLEMIFRDSFYHADPHPGNLMLLPDGAVGVLDCGMTGRLDEGLRDELEGLLLAVAGRNAEDLTEAVWRLGAVPAHCSRDRLQSDLSEFVADHTRQSLVELDLSATLNTLADIIRRHRIVLPPPVSMLLRTLVLLEGTSRALNPEFSLAELIRPFYLKAVGRRLSPRRLVVRAQRTYRDWDRLLALLPRELNHALMQIRAGRFRVSLEHRHLDPVVNRLVLGILTASLFLGSSLLWSTKALPVVGGISLFGAAGYLLAVYLGWRLFRAIRKSGDVGPDDD